MEIRHSKVAVGKAEADVLIVPLYDGEEAGRGPLKEIDRAMDGRLGEALERGELRGKLYEINPLPGTGTGCRLVYAVGAGKREDVDADRMRRVYGAAARAVRRRFASIAVVLRSDTHAQAAVEGVVLADFEPDLHRSERTPGRLEQVTVLSGKDLRRAIAAGQAVGDGVNLARTLVTEPPNELTPRRLAERAVEALTPLGVEVEVLEGKRLERFGGLRGVAQGSNEPPVLISATWNPARARKAPVLGLVGKGVTFDSGGLSLKPSEGMTWMKGDMAGAAAVIGALQAIATLKVPVAVRAAIPATENMPSGTATRVGDVLKLYSGKTAEILNTDAEGRLILHDALAWLGEQGVTHLVDAATLTGAVEIALGKVTIGVMGRPDAWVNKVVGASRKGGEKAWPLPLYPEYREQIRSEVADIKNVGGRAAGTITAGWFLAESVPDDLPWAHLDIAGVAWDDKKPFRAPGATGAGTAAFIRLAQDLAGK